jgi:hypothetical protein
MTTRGPFRSLAHGAHLSQLPTPPGDSHHPEEISFEPGRTHENHLSRCPSAGGMTRKPWIACQWSLRRDICRGNLATCRC